MSRARSFRGRVAVVTGAGSGIGRALARQLAADGTRLAISDIDSDGLAQTAAMIGTGARVDQLDVADRAAVLTYAESVAADLGVVNVVINNAGVAHSGELLGLSFADMERVMAVDFWGVVNGSKAFLPHLIASGNGNLVNLSSLFGLVPMPSQSAYVAAKYAVRGFTETLRMEMLAARLPVRVTCVHPGGVRTAIARKATGNAGEPITAQAEYFDRKLARTSAEHAAAVILRGAAHGRPRVLVGNDARLLHALETVSYRTWQRLGAARSGRLR